jgi:hypothetical protein
MSCNSVILAGISKDCATVNGAIGAEKDLILVNYDDFDLAATLASANREADDTNGNQGGLTAIKLKSGAVQYTFEGTDYSVQPNVSTEVKEDGGIWFLHSVAFTVYSKLAKDRKTLEDLGGSKVVAISVDRSTGLFELFGAQQGLKISGLERAYVGAQNSNFYTVTIATPDLAVVRESSLPELANSVEVAV